MCKDFIRGKLGENLLPKREEDGEKIENLGRAFIPCRWTPSEGERERSLYRNILHGLGRFGKAVGSP